MSDLIGVGRHSILSYLWYLARCDFGLRSLLQREARCAKKELKTLFKEEAAKQHKRMAVPPTSVVPLG